MFLRNANRSLRAVVLGFALGIELALKGAGLLGLPRQEWKDDADVVHVGTSLGFGRIGSRV